MSFQTTSFDPVSALVHAGSYTDHAPNAAPSVSPSAEAQLRADIQAARVDLYCDHNDRVVADIRLARKHLSASNHTRRFDVLTALNRAAWLTRHDDYQQAKAALEEAMRLLPPDDAQ